MGVVSSSNSSIISGISGLNFSSPSPLSYPLSGNSNKPTPLTLVPLPLQSATTTTPSGGVMSGQSQPIQLQFQQQLGSPLSSNFSSPRSSIVEEDEEQEQTKKVENN